MCCTTHTLPFLRWMGRHGQQGSSARLPHRRSGQGCLFALIFEREPHCAKSWMHSSTHNPSFAIGCRATLQIVSGSSVGLAGLQTQGRAGMQQIVPTFNHTTSYILHLRDCGLLKISDRAGL